RDLPGECTTEAGQMGATVALRDIVGEAEHALMIAVVPPERAFDGDALAFGHDHDRGRNQRSLVAVDEFHERLDAAFVFHLLALFDGMTLVCEHDGDT